MKDKRCFICKYQGKVSLESCYEQIYQANGKILTILLCYSHSVELFKTGQTNFMLKYKPNFSNVYGYEDDKLAFDFFR